MNLSQLKPISCAQALCSGGHHLEVLGHQASFARFSSPGLEQMEDRAFLYYLSVRYIMCSVLALGQVVGR